MSYSNLKKIKIKKDLKIHNINTHTHLSSKITPHPFPTHMHTHTHTHTHTQTHTHTHAHTVHLQSEDGTTLAHSYSCNVLVILMVMTDRQYLLFSHSRNFAHVSPGREIIILIAPAPVGIGIAIDAMEVFPVQGYDASSIVVVHHTAQTHTCICIYIYI